MSASKTNKDECLHRHRGAYKMVPGWTPGWRHTHPQNRQGMVGKGRGGRGGVGKGIAPLVEILNHFNS